MSLSPTHVYILVQHDCVYMVLLPESVTAYTLQDNRVHGLKNRELCFPDQYSCLLNNELSSLAKSVMDVRGQAPNKKN